MKTQNKKSGNKFDVECMECGKRFKTASWEPKCPKCGSHDVDIPLDRESILRGVASK